jgi:glycosyltransferase involved in cell wall biosynthesis
MRVLHLDSGSEMRGGQWQVLRLVEGLASAGVESTLLARAGSPLLAAALSRGCHAEPLGLLRALVATRSHDVIHAHDARTHTLAAILSGLPLVVSRRVAFPIRSRRKYARAAHYIAVSEFVRAILRSGGVPDEKISVVYDGVPILTRAHGRRILAPASDDPAKGAALAAEAARLAGVEIVFSADLERGLRRAGLFVYISHSEGLGSAVLLAMSAGVPVIASRTGGLPEIVHHGDTGLLVANDAEAIADAIRHLRGNPEIARRMGATARQCVVDRFSVDRMVHLTLEVYRQVLS